MYDVTDKLREEEQKLLPESEDNEEEKIRQANLSKALDALQEVLLAFDVGKKKRFPPPPPYPYIGTTGLMCMRNGLTPSVAIYDHLKPVDKTKLEAVYSYLKPYA